MTYHPKSDFMRVMMERGFLADCTDYQSLDDALMAGVVPGYIGFDDGQVTACRKPDPDYDAALDAKMRT